LTRNSPLLKISARPACSSGAFRIRPTGPPVLADPNQDPATAARISSPDTYVRFDAIEKSYDGETLVVRALDLSIGKGEFVTLLGPSGSGKTTTLMMLAGFEVPTRGRILLDGSDITRTPPHRRGIGMVFQNYALFPHMTVAENLAFPLEVRRIGKSDVKARVERALDMVQLAAFGARKPSQLSGGQQQRVALARALVFEPRLVLMDEPLGALDKQLREHMQYEIKHLHERLGVTVVYVTHDQGEALTMSDRVAVFNNGRIEQIASARDMYERPETAFVAQFIGENNELSGIVDRLEGGVACVRLACGSLVHARAGSGLGQGGSVIVSVRPERVRLDGDGQRSDGGRNRFAATVREVIYHGDHLRLRLAAFGAEDFIVKSSVLDGARPEVGAEIHIGWAVEEGHALAVP
jgi:putative spermidine/putrescine transport system ATP-binding protein